MALTDPNSKCVKCFTVGWMFIELVLLSGVGYGWASFVYIFKEEGIYSELCTDTTDDLYDRQDTNTSQSNVLTNDTVGNSTHVLTSNGEDKGGPFPTCVKQDSFMSLCFTIAAFVNCLYSVTLGHVNYRYGARVSRLISIACNASGMVCIAFVSRDTPWLMFPGVAGMLCGGVFMLISGAQIADCVFRGNALVVGLLSGALDSSSAMSLVIKQTFTAGFPRRYSMLILCGFQFMPVISTLFFPTPERKPRITEVKEKDHGEIAQTLENDKHADPENIAAQKPYNYLRQPMFLSHLAWFSLVQLRYLYFMGNLNTMLNRKLDDDTPKVSYFTDVCFYTLLGGLPLSVASGFMYSKLRKLFSGARSQMYRRLMPAITPLAIPPVMIIVASILLPLSNANVLYAVFINVLITRTFLYSVTLMFITLIYPVQVTAMLNGVTLLVGGVISCLQYAIFSWSASYDSASNHIEIVFLVTGMLTLGHPGYLFLTAKRAERRHNNNESQDEKDNTVHSTHL